MAEMDENGDGSIEFEEFAVAMHHNYDDGLIEQAAKVRADTRGGSRASGRQARPGQAARRGRYGTGRGGAINKQARHNRQARASSQMSVGRGGGGARAGRLRASVNPRMSSGGVGEGGMVKIVV